MSARTSSVNPAVLRWARERSGLSVEDAATAIGRPADAVRDWEAGTSSPTYRQLAELAQRVYKRPVAVFFFPTPPEENSISSQFRTLPRADVEALEPDTLYALRDARALQMAIPDLLAGMETPISRSVDELRAVTGEGATSLAERMRRVFAVSDADQRSWRSADQALKEWRQVVERFGVFVFKRSFTQSDVSGFCLDDERYPLVMINNGTAHTRQIFTLFHELGHIAFRVSGVTTRDQRNLGSLAPTARDIEVTCNRFAADFLVPWSAFDWRSLNESAALAAIPTMARSFHVSREVVLRRFCDAGAVTPARYDEVVAEWSDDYFRDGGDSGGGSYYANQGTYLSETYVRAALGNYHAGRLGIGELADHLRMKARNVTRFEDFILSRGNAE